LRHRHAADDHRVVGEVQLPGGVGVQSGEGDGLGERRLRLRERAVGDVERSVSQRVAVAGDERPAETVVPPV